VTSGARAPFLADISLRDRSRLTERAVPRFLDRGDVLFLAGDPGGRTCLVTSGAIKLVGRDERGRETILALALPGDLVGAEAAIDGLPQPTDAIAATRTTVLGLDPRLLASTMNKDGRAAVAVARAVASRLRWSYASTLERSGLGATARLAARLLELADVLGRPCGDAIEVDLPMGRADLAGLAGMCRESASKALGQLKRDGLVDCRGRRVRILRRDLLDRIRTQGR
jgi:CRP-like cAMP-binding protein